jgi:hypothetical protein
MPQSKDSKYRNYVSAIDVSQRLLRDLDVNELLVWPPNLFAFTSYILSVTGAYQLVISPPRSKKWPPSEKEIKKWFGNLENNAEAWLMNAVKFDDSPDRNAKPGALAKFKAAIGKEREKIPLWVIGAKEEGVPLWPYLVREVGNEWQENLKSLDKNFISLLKDAGDREPARAQALLEMLTKKTPALVVACWVNFYNLKLRKPSPISNLLCNHGECTEEQLNENWSAAQSLLTLHAIVDEACVGWGIYDPKSPQYKKFGDGLRFAEHLLLSDGTMATISNERCRVLPKRHNPNIGITLRSLSCNLAFHRSSIGVNWGKAENNPLSNRLNEELSPSKEAQPKENQPSAIISVLLLPWPMEVLTSDFGDYRSKLGKKENPIELSQGYDFFVYNPHKDPELIANVARMLKASVGSEKTGVDILVMPESALHIEDDKSQVNDLADKMADYAKSDKAFSVFVVGAREEEKGATFLRNTVYCRTLNNSEDNGGKKDKENYGQTRQSKHHRWKLDKEQIKQYGLSNVLQSDRSWWEAIKVEKRKVNFINLGNKITLCPLICEDLARQDPIADLIRHVGPTLVVTILMDGPQKLQRWSARYASVLSEDPGSAVITLTSYGMVRRWNSPYHRMSNIVALWSEGQGQAREIELAPGAEGILLRLKVDLKKEPIADGRVEKDATARISLEDVIQIYRKQEPTPESGKGDKAKTKK